MHRFAKPVGSSRTSTSSGSASAGNRSEDGIEGERRLWHALARRVAAGEAGAAELFHERYRTGVRMFLRRNLGAVGLESLVEETLAGAIEEIRRGSLRAPKHFVQFVRAVADRYGQADAPREERRPIPAIVPSDRLRLRETELAVHRALGEFTPGEREILTSYYSRGLSRAEIEARFGIAGVKLDELRIRMQDLVRPQREHRTPAVDRRALLARRASAGAE